MIELHPRMRKNVHVEEWIDQVGAYPPYLDVDKGNFKATFTRMPDAGEVQVPVNVQLVVEYYNRLT